MPFQVTNPNILGNLQAGLQIGRGIQDRRLQQQDREDQAGARDIFSRTTSLLELQGAQRSQGLQGMLAQAQQSGNQEEVDVISNLLQMDSPTQTQNLRQLQLQAGQTLGIDPNKFSGRGGLASAKTELFPNGTAIQGLPNGQIQVTDPRGNIVTDPDERIRVLEEAQRSRITQAGGKAEAVQTAETKALIRREKLLTEKQYKFKLQEIQLAKDQMSINAEKVKSNTLSGEAQGTVDLGNSLLAGDLASIYGRGESLFPELLRSQEGIDLFAKRDKFVATLELAQAGKLKGQGQVSEGERVILKKAATALSNPNISAELAEEEINLAIESIMRTLPEDQRINFGQSQTQEASLPTITTQEGFDALPSGASFIEDGKVLVKE